MNETFTITTPIYYASGKPHIGHAFTTLTADILARYHRQKGKDVFFLAGMDEHGAKIAQNAEKAGKAPQEYVDELAEVYRAVWKRLGIEYTKFIRTTSEEHKKGVRAFITRLKEAGDIYEGEYEGLYCIDCEKFITEKDLVDSKCPDHKTFPQHLKEKNYFFALEKHLGAIAEKIRSGELCITPESRRNETLKFFSAGLNDFSISRESVKWGIPVPFDESQVIYVWVEALMNYITALGFPDGEQYKKYWPADVQIIGAEINKFHTIFWPALLHAIGEPLPRNIFIHGLFTIDGEKISKTVGNVIDPIEIVDQFGTDAARYLIVSQFSAVEHGDIKAEEFAQKYNSDLANGIGNVFERIYALVRKHGVGEGSGDAQIARDIQEHAMRYEKNMEGYKIHDALLDAFAAVRVLDQYINQTEAWTLAKEEKREELYTVLATLWHGIGIIADLFRPVLPETIRRADEYREHIAAGSGADEKLALFPRIEE